MNSLFILITLLYYMVQPSFILKEKKLTLNSGSDLLYTISTPTKISGNEKVPLIIALHWGWDTDKPIPAWYGKEFLTGLIQPAFKDINPVIIAPDCPAENWYNESSEEAVLALKDFILTEYPIDSGRIFITGFSAGGIGAWYISSRHPELFSMVVPMACEPEQEWIRNWNDLPVYIIHGTADELFPFSEIKKLSTGLEQQNVTVKLIRIENASHYDTGKYIAPLQYSSIWFEKLLK